MCSRVYITLIETETDHFLGSGPICVNANESPLSLASDEEMTTFAWRSKHYQIWWIDAFTLDLSCKCQPWFIVTGKSSWLSAVLLLVSLLDGQISDKCLLYWTDVSSLRDWPLSNQIIPRCHSLLWVCYESHSSCAKASCASVWAAVDQQYQCNIAKTTIVIGRISNPKYWMSCPRLFVLLIWYMEWILWLTGEILTVF